MSSLSSDVTRMQLQESSLPSWPVFADDEIDAASAVLRSGKVNYWTGVQVARFEQEFAASHGLNHGVAVANGSLALELALRVLGIGVGDEVIVTPRSFFASASAIVLSGATPVFADVDLDSGNMTAESIKPLVGPRTKAILVVHLAGWPCEINEIQALSRSKGLFLIEDCAQAHGARIGDRFVGSFGDVACFSFCQDKIMTTGGEGGMLVTNSKPIRDEAWSFKDHGKDPSILNGSAREPGFQWVHTSFGSNWRMTEFQAAIGRVQLKKLAKWVSVRERNAAIFADALSDIDLIRVPMPKPPVFASFYKLYGYLNLERLKATWTRERILAEMTSKGVPGLSGTCPEIYRERAFSNRKLPRLPNAALLGETSLMFLVHPTMNDDHILRYAETVRSILVTATA